MSSFDESNKKYGELSRFLEKYKLSGIQCPYIMSYNSKKDRIILLGVDILQVEKDGVVTIDIPECVDEISCWNLLRLPDNFPGFQDEYANTIRRVKLAENNKALYGKLDDLLCLTVVNCDNMKERTGDKYRLENVEILEISNMDFSNIQSIKFIASQSKFSTLNYSKRLKELRLINCRGLKSIPSLDYYNLISNGTPDFDWSMVKIKNTDALDNTFAFNDKLTYENLERSRILKDLHPIKMINTFFGCKKLKKIPDLDYSKCMKLSGTFSNSGICGNLEISDIEYPLKMNELSSIFSDTDIENMDIHDIEFVSDNENEFEAYELFKGSKIRKIKIHNIRIIGYRNIDLTELFGSMPCVEEIELSNIDFDTADVKISRMFVNLPRLKRVVISKIKCNSLYTTKMMSLVSIKDTVVSPIFLNCTDL